MMSAEWLAIADDMAESARAKVAQDQEKLNSILKPPGREPEKAVAASQ